MAGDTDTETKSVNSGKVDIDSYRKLVQNYLNLHVYESALYWADKVVALSCGNPRDFYWLAQCMYLSKQLHRAAHLLKSLELEKTNIMCNYLTARCLYESHEYNEALNVVQLPKVESFLQDPFTTSNLTPDSELYDSTSKVNVQSSILLLKGKILEALDNHVLAAECYKQAVCADVYCLEAFDSLIKHQMLSYTQEEELLNLLPITQQCNSEEAEMIYMLYRSKLKKYHASQSLAAIDKAIKKLSKNNPVTPPSTIENNEKDTLSKNAKPENMSIDALETPAICRLTKSLDMDVSKAEVLYYNCEYHLCSKLTESILREDPYHMQCLPIHISCLVELKKGNKLFTLGHNLVDLYPNLAISWYAVGCYYYVIGNREKARQYLSKSSALDRLFGPAWLAFGHSYAVDSEHDQAMAAYFKASQLMKGCHLPTLYIGLECGLTNNVRLADKFFLQAQTIAPDDPFVMHEMGVVAFCNLEYKTAEKHFLNALSRVKIIKKAIISEHWEPLLNNLGHTCRKLKKYNEALEYHHQALVMCPLSAKTFSAIGYIHAIKGEVSEAVEWFHKALSLKRDDIVSATMLNYVIEQSAEVDLPFPDASDDIPAFRVRDTTENLTEDSEEYYFCCKQNITASDMSIEADMSMDESGVSRE